MHCYKSLLLCAVQSHTGSSTLQSVMQTATLSQQGQDKKRCHGTQGKTGGGRTQRLRSSKAGRVKWRPAIRILGTKDK